MTLGRLVMLTGCRFGRNVLVGIGNSRDQTVDGMWSTIAIGDGGKPRTKILPGKIWGGEPAKGMCDINGKGVGGLKNYLRHGHNSNYLLIPFTTA